MTLPFIIFFHSLIYVLYSRDLNSSLTVDIVMMITSHLLLNEMITARCNSGDRFYTLIPVSCLGGHLKFQPLVRMPNAMKDTSLKIRQGITQELLPRNFGRPGQTTDSDGGESHEVIMRLIWRQEWDMW